MPIILLVSTAISKLITSPEFNPIRILLDSAFLKFFKIIFAKKNKIWKFHELFKHFFNFIEFLEHFREIRKNRQFVWKIW